MTPVGLHLIRLFALFGFLFVVGVIAALRERARKRKRSELPR
ncbi:MAG: hypothetical protein ACLQVI_38460 [Polyangiaceae bacterium]|jgi:hypothetical protein